MIKVLKKVNYLRKQRNYKKFIDKILKVVDFTPIENKIPEKVEKVTFIIPGMPLYSGGHTSILRLGTELSKNGYDVRYFSIYDNETLEEMKSNAEATLAGYKGTFIDGSIEDIETDVVIATQWDTVYHAKKINGYKMYFVQDYEPYFHLYGECFLMAQKTYELGYHMVSLGAWNKATIERECNVNSQIDTVTFPYEGKEYYDKGRDFDKYPHKNKFNIAVYVKDTGKRAPYITQYMLKKLKEDLLQEGITLNIKYFGETKDFICDGGENLGKLNKSQLLDLYNSSDFGMVASLTNISLVPYEMLATGLPIIEFKEGTFNYFFPEKSALVTSFDYKELRKLFTDAIKNPETLKYLNKTSKEFLSTLSWKNTGKEFVDILNKVK